MLVHFLALIAAHHLRIGLITFLPSYSLYLVYFLLFSSLHSCFLSYNQSCKMLSYFFYLLVSSVLSAGIILSSVASFLDYLPAHFLCILFACFLHLKNFSNLFDCFLAFLPADTLAVGLLDSSHFAPSNSSSLFACNLGSLGTKIIPISWLTWYLCCPCSYSGLACLRESKQTRRRIWVCKTETKQARHNMLGKMKARM